MELPVKRPQYPWDSETRYKLKTKNLSYKLSQPSYGWLQWKVDPTYNTNNNKHLLENVTCEAKPGELTAIAGPSGAGKTTLLGILAGTIVDPSGILSGHVLVNDKPMNVSHFRRISGYVTQDEILFPLLTVQETLTYTARLRTKDLNANSTVQKLIKVLGLEHVASVRVGSESSKTISGGEKRRLSIGVELVHDPSVILLDEPTSGLDSASALGIMLLLKSMSRDQNKTVLVTIHQPGFRILDLLDKVILLSKGKVLHEGSLQLLEERLMSAGHEIPRHVNVLELAMDVSWDSLCNNKYDKNDDGHIETNNTEFENKLVYSNSRFEEVLILSQRFSKNVFRTKQLFAARTGQAFLAGIVLGTIFTNAFKRGKVQNQLGFFAFTLTFLMSSTTEALPIFLQERRVLTKETSCGAYRVSSYVIANALVFIPFLLIVSLLYATPVYWLVGLRVEIDGFLYFTLVVWLVLMMSNSVVACFSALVPNFVTGMSLIAGVMGSFFLFSGYFVAKDDVPRYWGFMKYLSLFKYPFECFMINEFGGEQGKLKCLESVEGGCLVYGDRFLMQQGLKEELKWSYLVVMLSFILGYRFLGFVFLWYRSC
ncbi:hypothetical protein CASFOL_025267 [Castilleja foliolosa]|uniref:ABC transporter domain-containing protein n=1 Tax=Castilleja foliolosa TaxID=1961234 RepID=A0ABD3CRJ2_9LAMI